MGYKGGTSDFSSDLSLGRRPTAESDEFFVWTSIVIEISHETAEIKCYPLSEHDSAAPARDVGCGALPKTHTFNKMINV